MTAPPPAADVRLLGPGEVRSMAGRLGVRPAKALGQNFVHDPNTVRRIARLAAVGPGDRVIEIGPGLGSLTLALLETGAEVIAVEIDPVLAGALPATVAEHAPQAVGRFRLLVADALHIEPDDVTAATAEGSAGEPGTGAGRGTGAGPARQPEVLVANLPYNVAVPVLLNALQCFDGLQRGLVMVQAEVAERLAARPGEPAYGVPSAKAAWYADVRRAGAVSRQVFWPVPNVESGLVAWVRRGPPSTPASRAQVFACIDAAFAQRRKTLRAALARWAGSAQAAEQVCRAAGVDPGARGEQLGIEQFAALAAAGARQPGEAPSAEAAPRRGAGR